MKQLKSLFRRYPFCLLISAALCVLPFFFTKIYYMYGDDYLMNYIANGSYGIPWSDHLVFPKMLFGTITKFLYGLTKGVNWYAVLLVATIALAYSVFHWVLVQLSGSFIALLISLVLNAVTVPMMLTFTVSGFLIVAAGAALLYLAFFSGKALRLIVPGILMILWGYVIRDSTVIPALGIMTPLALRALLTLLKSRGDERRKLALNLAKLAGAMLLSIGCILALRKWEHRAYGSDTWSSFARYNDARSEVLDYPGVGYKVLADAYREIGLSHEEYDLLYRWTFCEKSAFPEEKLLQIAAVQKNIYSSPWRVQFTKNALSGRTSTCVWLLPLLLLLFFALIDPEFKVVGGILQYVFFMAVILALCYIRLRFVLRVAVPLMFIGVYSILLCTRKPVRRSRFFVAAGAVAGAVLLFFSVRFFRGFMDSVASLRDPAIEVSSRAALEEVRSHPERNYVTESYAFGRMYYYGHSIDEIRTIDDYTHLIRSGSWDSFTPRYYSLVEGMGVSDPDNLLSSLLTDETLYLLTDNPGTILNYLRTTTDREIKVAETPIGDGFLKSVSFSLEE